MTTMERWLQIKAFFQGVACLSLPTSLPDEVYDSFYGGVRRVLLSCADDNIIDYLTGEDGLLLGNRYLALIAGDDHPDEWMLADA